MLRLVTAIGTLCAVVGMTAPASAQRLVPCAGEGGFCRVPYPTTVVYGAGGSTHSREVGPGGIPCSNRVFGDPAYGVPKTCYFVERGYQRHHEHRGYRDQRDYRDYRDSRRGY